MLAESNLAREMGTTQNGTDYIGQVANVLNKHLGGGYVVRAIPNDPPTREQVELLWDDVVKSIDAGFGVVDNIMVPPSNYPRGTRGSVSPAYGGGDVYHYRPIMGYADDGPGGRHFWIADSGFPPFGYWNSLEQNASMIAGKGYTAKPIGGEPELDAAGVKGFVEAFFGPLASDVKDVREQLTGGRNKGQYPGWAQLDGKTFVDGVADLRRRVVEL
jgi:hypothetical protein